MKTKNGNKGVAMEVKGRWRRLWTVEGVNGLDGLDAKKAHLVFDVLDFCLVPCTCSRMDLGFRLEFQPQGQKLFNFFQLSFPAWRH